MDAMGQECSGAIDACDCLDCRAVRADGDWCSGEDDRDPEMDFADPGGRSALRAAGPGNPRNLPCPTCGAPDRLTPKDRRLGYQCDGCADRAEGGGY